MTNKPDAAEEAAREIWRQLPMLQVARTDEVDASRCGRLHNKYNARIEADIAAIIRRVCKEDLPKLPWPEDDELIGPFTLEAGEQGEQSGETYAYWALVNTKGKTIWLYDDEKEGQARLILRLLNAAWDAQQKGGE